MRRHANATALVLILALMSQPAPAASPAEASSRTTDIGRPNIVLILTDDQRYDTLDAMPRVNALIAREGVRFDDAFVVNPLCCPSRATILKGAYSHTTGVYTNDERNHGGYAAFDPKHTIATALRRVGYRTALFGKYFNGYHGQRQPPGWDRWFSTFGVQSSYYDYRADDDGRIRRFGSAPSDYGTTVLRREATSFIRSAPGGRPLFMYVAPHAPHAPATPAPQDRNAFRDLAPLDLPAFNEREVGDKPAYIRSLPPISSGRERIINAFRLQQYRSLLAVDRMVAEIVDALRDTGRLHNTLLVFTSDNGFLWGEHRYRTKDVPYEESIRVPMVMRYDRLGVSPRVDSHLVANLDLAPTFAAAAGVHLPGMEGRSLLPLLAGYSPRWRSALLVEHLRYGSPQPVPSFCMLRTERYAYVRYDGGQRELYDLRVDPAQMDNLDHSPSHRSTRRKLDRRLHRLCHPAPPGFSWG